MDIVPRFRSNLVQMVGETAQRLAPGKTENLLQVFGQADVGEIGSGKNHHGLAGLAQAFRPMAELVGLALSGLTKQRENCLVGREEPGPGSVQSFTIHEKFPVVFLLGIDAVQVPG